MRLALLLATLITGCVDHEFSADLDAFDSPTIRLGQPFGAIVDLEPHEKYDDGDVMCPVLDDVTVTLGGVEMEMVDPGGYVNDDFDIGCTTAQFSLHDVPAVAGINVELHTPKQSRICSLQDRHLDAGIELVDGGTWELSSREPVRVRFGRDIEARDGVSVKITQAQVMMLTSRATSEGNGVYSVNLQGLTPGEYTLELDENVNLNDRGPCFIWTGAFAKQTLTIVETP